MERMARNLGCKLLLALWSDHHNLINAMGQKRSESGWAAGTEVTEFVALCTVMKGWDFCYAKHCIPKSMDIESSPHRQRVLAENRALRLDSL